MSGSNENLNRRGQRITPPDDPGTFIGKRWRKLIVDAINAFWNPNINVKTIASDGVSTVTTPCKIDMSPLGWTATVDLTLDGPQSASVPFSGSGAPSATTLAATAAYSAGPIPSLYVDTAGLNLYVCTTAGSNSTSVWSQISSGSSSSGAQQFAICWDAGDWWVSLSYNGSYGTVVQNIIKPYKLRTSGYGVASEIIRGVTYSYGYSAAAAVTFTFQGITFTSVTPYSTRAVTGSDGSSETDYTIPDPVVGNLIYAVPVSGVPGIPLTILTVAVVGGGSGYTVNQILTISGGTGTAATIKVLTVNGSGAILTCQMNSPGSYNPLPTLAGATVTTGSATFNLTQAPMLIDINADGRAWTGSTNS